MIHVEGISKRYQLGVERHDKLWDMWVHKARRMFSGGQRATDTDSDHFWALKDVSFDVAEGEVVGIIGRNGAGKSTLLKILSRITPPTEGQIRLKGRVASLLEVGTGFHPELSGRENVFMNGAILGMSRAEIKAKFDEIVAFSEVEKFIDTAVKHYSSGMYVRLAFAVAAHLEPEILVVDEVLAVGDSAFQRKCIGRMGDVASAGRTVLFVSHNLGMVQTLCKRAVLLSEGRVVTSGEVGAVLEDYTTMLSENEVLAHTRFDIDPEKRGQLLEASLHDRNGEPCGRFDVFDPIMLTVTYTLREPIEGAALNLVVYRNTELLFVSFDTDRAPELLHAREPGTYQATVQLPGPLKAGNYDVALSIGILNMGGVDSRPEALRFVVSEYSFDTSKKSYCAQRPGPMAADLEWSLQRQGNH
ncbi:MAG: ABC transporter ATP-binding protein [Nitrospirota bacterium]|nr:ABC transporter ATP-binding protein [Nitrospirota bacterium]